MVSTRRRFLRRLGGLGGVLTSGVLGGCAEAGIGEQPVPRVRVGSKPFPEQQILSYLAFERLTTIDGVQIINEIGYGSSEENWEATATGVKDLYWEYTGTAWSRLPPRHDQRVTDPQRLYDLVESDARTQNVRMAQPASFSNEYVLVADREWSDRTGVTTLEEFAMYVADESTAVGIAVNEDFYHRRDGWNGVTAYYGLTAEQQRALERGTFIVTSVGLTYELLDSGRIQVASGFATDPQLSRDSLVTLTDDREYFLPYQPAPTAHAPTVADQPAIFEVLEPVVSTLDAATMRRLNRRVILEDQSPRTVAKSYLRRLGDNR